MMPYFTYEDNFVDRIVQGQARLSQLSLSHDGRHRKKYRDSGRGCGAMASQPAAFRWPMMARLKALRHGYNKDHL